MNNRKIIGYKLIKPEYKDAACVIGDRGYEDQSGINDTNSYIKDDILSTDAARSIRLLKETKVFDLWFEPVYEEEEYKVGDWVITKDYSGYYDGKALKITKLFEEYDITYAYFEPNNSTSHNFVFPDNILRKATPEEIEKATTEVVRMGGENGFDLTVKNKKIYHKNENITGYVSNVKQWWWRNCDQNFNTYSFKIKDIILSKTGCESKETRLSEWIALADKIGV